MAARGLGRGHQRKLAGVATRHAASRIWRHIRRCFRQFHSAAMGRQSPSVSQLRCQTKLLAAASNTGRTSARSAGSPGLPAEPSRKSVVFWDIPKRAFSSEKYSPLVSHHTPILLAVSQ